MGLSSYYRQYDEQNSAELERQKEALRQMSETQKQLVNDNADASIKQIQEAGNADIREAERAYDGIINTANVQKLINERQVAERMANLGLTDSGLNRTQQTAVQVGHSNQINNIQVARQKQIDALALATKQKIGSIEIQRNADLTDIDLSHQENLYSADEKYSENRDSWAASAYDADQQAAAARDKAKMEAEENAAEEKKSARTNLIEIVRDKNRSSSIKTDYVKEYFSRYGMPEDPTLYAELKEAGVWFGYTVYNPSEIGTEAEIGRRARVASAEGYLRLHSQTKTKTEAIEYVRDLYSEGRIYPEEAEYLTRYILDVYEDDGVIKKENTTRK